MHRSSVRIVAVSVLLLVRGSTPFLAQTATIESKLKAAFVSKFPQFVDWPSAALAGRTSVDICVASPDPFGSDLNDLIAGETLNGRAMAVRRVDREQEVEACQVLFLPTQAGGPHPFLRRAAGLPILTVGDNPRFLDDGGIVGLRIVEGRVRFDINAGAAQRVGLRISSQLLQMALTVRGVVP